MRTYTKSILFVILLNVCLFPQANDKYIRLKTGIHFDSKVSGGKYDLVELGAIIDRSDLDVAIITDHDNMKVSYGIAPFQNLLKYSIEENSIGTFGVKNYLNLIDQIDETFKDVIIMPGVEAVPFYYWQGSPMNENLRLENWHTHLLVFGMNSADDYQNLPSLANGIGYQSPSGHLFKYIATYFMYFSTCLLAIVLFLISLFSIIRRKTTLDIARIHRKSYRYRMSWIALILTVVFGIYLHSEFPFLPRLYDQYHDNQGAGPFQRLIDYVNEKNGLVFWAHPEVSHTEERTVNIPLVPQKIIIETESYPQLISQTTDYTGFAVFWEGFKVIGKPGGIWDLVLTEYCNGFRKKPVWGIGELDFEEANDLSLVTETNTFVFAKEKSQKGVIDAYRAGRMYATRGYAGNKIVLEDFSAYDMRTGKNAFIGETLPLSQPPVVLHIRMKALENLKSAQTVLLFRGNVCIQRFRLSNLIDEWFVDENPPKDQMFYYRIYLGETWQTLVTNPIFVKR